VELDLMSAAARNIEMTQRIAVRVASTAFVAEDVISIDLASTGSDPLPRFEAGAHIELFLPNGMARCYSLVNPLAGRGVYRVVVQKDRASRGASAYVVDRLRAGVELMVTAPRNNFALIDSAPYVRLIAGGIGITPLWAMAQVLATRSARWDIFYAARSRASAAFADSLATLAPACVRFHFDDERGDTPPDLRPLLAEASAGTHFYCCGPNPMLAAFEAAAAAVPRSCIHTEYFTAKEEAVRTGGFSVELARSGKTVFVAPGQTILDALIAAGLNVRFMCTEGVCGECETQVLSGKPEHRDSYLTDEERRSNKVMMICCSGASSEKLVLDL
jgi:vanillate O-demethylase ferredoxin subunit